MKTLSSLQNFFYENIFPNLKYLEEKRVKIYTRLKYSVIALFIVTLLVAFLFKDIFSNSLEFTFILISIPIAIFSFIYKVEISGFSSLFKDEVIEQLVDFIDSSLLYEKNGYIRVVEYKKSSLFPLHVDRYKGDDFVSGNVEGVALRFSEIHSEVEKKNSKGKTYWQTIFKGLLFIADFNKNFKGKTVILPDSAESFIGSFAHFFQSFSSHGELIKMDNPEFEKEFVVYSSDQIEARYILSHSLMDSIMRYKKIVGKNLSISFVGSNIYIAIGFKQKLFEPKIYKSVQNFDEVRFYFEVLSMTVDIVNILKLNRRIWSKR